jgi:pentapeptide repeat protein
MGSPARFGSGRSEPQDVPGGSGTGRREAPFGPEISWPYGFRPLDAESRDVLESAYGTGSMNTGPANTGPMNTGPMNTGPMNTGPANARSVNPGYGAGSVYQPQALDDYGDPGYSDPSYDGPSYGGSSYSGRSGSGGSGFSGAGYSGGPAASSPSGSGGFGTPRGFGGDSRRPSSGAPGYQLPEASRVQDSPRSGYQHPASSGEIWPVTGAQEALPDTGSRPSADGRRGYPRSGQPGYPDQWYDHPRMDDRALDERRSSRSPDPRLDGMTYGELRYDDTGSFAAASFDSEPEPRAEGLDEEAWYRELRQSGPAHRPNPPVPPSPISGPQRRVDPLGPLGPPFGSSSGGYPQAQDRGRGGQPRWDGPGRPQMSAGPNAGRPAGRGSSPQGPQVPAAPGAKPADSASPSSASPNGVSQASGFLSAPAASVGLLTPPGGTRVDALRDGGALPAAPATAMAPASPAAQGVEATRAFEAVKAPADARPRPAGVRPGHGLDGPSITGSWPAQPASDDLESYDDFWRDDADEEYTGLFGDREAEFKRAAAKQAAAAKRQAGRRRGRSNDHRLWLGLGAVVVVAAAAIGGIVKFEFGSHASGPAHELVAPAALGDYTRTKNVERQADVDGLKRKLIKATGGQATGFVTAVYESGNSAAGNNTQIVMLVTAHLANADPDAAIAAFKQQYKGAEIVSAGPGGGKAVCAQLGKVEALCAWFDNDSMGFVDSLTMKADALAKEMQAMRPSVELRAKG